MKTTDAPSTFEIVSQRCFQRLEAAQAAGEDIKPAVIEVYATFARDAAERWWLHTHAGSSVHPHAARLADLALRDQIEVVPTLNAESFGRTDRVLDRECCAATRQAFHDRVRELRAGWSS